jgi:hypothetical protein
MFKNLYKLKLPKWIGDNFDRLMDSRDLDFFFNFRTTEMGKLMSGKFDEIFSFPNVILLLNFIISLLKVAF